MAYLLKHTIQINYDGTKQDLIINIDKIATALGKNNLYHNDISNLREYVLKNLLFYSLFWRVNVGSISLINDKALNKNTYYWYKRPIDENPIVYNDFYMRLLYFIILIAVIIFIFIFIYCYIYDIDVSFYISNIVYM